jgi:pimeloyl-ACP methyl ester carboxylesterase
MIPPSAARKPLMISNRTVTVFGAYGHTGRFVVSELYKRGWTPILSGRDVAKLDTVADAHPESEVRLGSHTLAIEARLKTLKAPTLIAWGTDDVYFEVKWSHWLSDNIPGTRRRVEFKDARIFFPEERWEEFNKELRAHWQTAQQMTS